MSQKNICLNRPRSSSKTSYKDSSANESPKYSNISRNRIQSGIKIEERLMNQQVTYKRRLECLKKTIEMEELKEVQSKPKISSKSRSLAQRAEQRMMEQYNFIKQPNIEVEKTAPQVQPDYTSRSTSVAKSINSTFFAPAEKIVKNDKIEKNEKIRTKSLLNLSVLERNQTWLEEKQSKIDKRKKEKDIKDLAECTFSPKTQSKVKHSRSIKENPNNNISYISSPGVNETCEVNVGYKGTYRSYGYRPIAPYQIQVAFKCGIDLNSFMRRAK
jgi:hypothetical protein